MRVQVWAPRAREGVQVLPAGTGDDRLWPAVALAPETDRPGWYSGDIRWLRHGVRYMLTLDGGEPLPDPLARRLPDGVHGAPQAWDPATYRWQDASWRGRSIDDGGVLYELHVGTFTSGGTLDTAVAELERLRDLGVTHVELMPLAAFDGAHGWGYDGVGLNAVHEPYGGPDALCRFVDAAHAHGLAVVLDVVHNHLGPSGNHWEEFGPFQTGAHTTPWGAGVNLDAPGSDDVRAILVGSARRWITDFHLDGLRLDAVHELRDSRALTYPEELAAAFDALAGELGRPLALIAEADRNDATTVLPRRAGGGGGLGLTAQSDDDVHHALHWLVTGETQGYYEDFGSVGAVEHALEQAFLHDGRWSSFRGRTHGRPVDWTRTDPWRFVVSLQTHDQVGNRALGERIASLAGRDRAAGAAAVLLTLPYTPMLFMGEEWGATTPWQFFTSFADPALASAVTDGRRTEFAAHGWAAGDIPDPQDPQTFERSRLGPRAGAAGDTGDTGDSEMVRWYRDLLALRRSEPALGPATRGAAPTAGGVRCTVSAGPDGRALTFVLARGPWRTVLNLSDEPADIALGPQVGSTEVVLAWRGGAAVLPVRPDLLRLDPAGAAVVRVADSPAAAAPSQE